MKKFSCLCATFARPPERQYLLEEAVQSFLQQSWGNKELIVVNDCPQQTIVFDHPEVVVVNLPKRCQTLGEKYNLAASLAAGDYLMPWDDDDISLPMRIEIAAKTLEKLGSHYYKALGQWTLHSRGISRAESFVGHNSSAYSRKAFVKAGLYPALSWGADTALDQKLKALGPVAAGEVSKQDWQYIYRWGVSDLHVSAIGSPAQLEESWTLSGKKEVKAGVYELQPKWLYPYSTLIQQASRSGMPIYPTPDLEFWR